MWRRSSRHLPICMASTVSSWSRRPWRISRRCSAHDSVSGVNAFKSSELIGRCVDTLGDLWSDERTLKLSCRHKNRLSPLLRSSTRSATDLEQVDHEFGRHVQSQVDLIPKIGKYIQTSGGKRMRPAVLLMAARLSGYQGDRAVLYAAVVEFIHTATLVHDDIIDDSDLRRGRLAVHSRWGNDITVLLGDYLYIKSMALALTHDSLEVIRLLCDVTLRMIEGSSISSRRTATPTSPRTSTSTSSGAKRRICSADVREIGGLLGKVGSEREQALREYGFNLGIAFQLVDDLLDVTGDAETLGKPVGGDLREGKMTLPLIHLLRQNDGVGGRIVRDIISSRTIVPGQWEELLHSLKEHRSIDYAYPSRVRVRRMREETTLRVSAELGTRRTSGVARLYSFPRPLACSRSTCLHSG